MTEIKVTVQNSLSREVFWHVYAKIPRHTCQNSIAQGEFICANNEPKSVPAQDLGDCRDNLRNTQSAFLIVEFWLRICEGTEQMRIKKESGGNS